MVIAELLLGALRLLMLLIDLPGSEGPVWPSALLAALPCAGVLLRLRSPGRMLRLDVFPLTARLLPLRFGYAILFPLGRLALLLKITALRMSVLCIGGSADPEKQSQRRSTEEFKRFHKCPDS